MKEMKAYVGLSNDNKVLFIEPLNKETGKTAETKIMILRLLTQEEYDREIREAMQDGCRTYKRVKRRVREIR